MEERQIQRPGFGICFMGKWKTITSRSTWADADGANISTLILSEVSIMEMIRTKTTIPVPRVSGYDVSTKSIGYLYILIEALPGQVPNGRMALSIPDIHEEKFASQLAGFPYELMIRFSQIGRILYSHESSQHELLPFSITGFVNEIGQLSTLLEFLYAKGRKMQSSKTSMESRNGKRQLVAR